MLRELKFNPSDILTIAPKNVDTLKSRTSCLIGTLCFPNASLKSGHLSDRDTPSRSQKVSAFGGYKFVICQTKIVIRQIMLFTEFFFFLQKAKFEGQIAELKQKCADEKEEVRSWEGGTPLPFLSSQRFFVCVGM